MSTASTSTSSTSSFVVVLSHSGSLLLLDIHTCQIVVLFDASEQPDSERIKDLAVSPTGRHLLTCTDKMKVRWLEEMGEDPNLMTVLEYALTMSLNAFSVVSR